MKALYQFGEFRLDLANKALFRNGIQVPLTPKVFDALTLLVENSGQLVEKDVFMRRLWPETFVEEAVLADNISRLRRALGDPGGQRFIATVPKRGYRFSAGVRLGPTEVKEPLAARKRPRWRGPGFAVPGIAALLMVSVALFYFFRYHDALFSPVPPIRSLAVLPLESLSRDPEQEYFADGMTDELITQVAKISALRVISRTSMMRYKGTRKPLAQIAQELGVDGIVEGTILRSGGRVRVTIQVIQGKPERHVWAERYDRSLADAVLLQGELAREIAQAIRVKLTPQEQSSLANVRRVDDQSYEAFLKGRYFWSKRTEDGTQKAIQYFQQATERDPNYALAFTGLADSYISLALTEALQETLPPTEAFPKARAAVDKALAIDDNLAEAHASLGHIRFQYDRDWQGAEKEFQRAIELNPNYANAHQWYALSLMWMDRPDEALHQAELARELDPLSLVINANLGFILAGTRHYDQGIEQCRKTLDLDPNFALAHYRLGQIYVLKGMYVEAIPELQKAIVLSGDSPRAVAELGLAYALLGRKSEARKRLDDLKERAKLRYVSPFTFALIYGGLGDRDQTLQWLERAIEGRSPSLNLLKWSPAFASLRSQPRFAELVRRAGLPP